ncbi:MAG: acyl-CoA dehydrogenase family protein [Ilumatobacter sp.]
MTATLSTSSPATTSLRERIADILPTIAANAQQAEQQRQVPQENIDLLHEVGFFAAFQPRRFGGLELGADEYGMALIDLAGACASTAWASGLLAQHSHMVALMSDQLQQEIWGDDRRTLVSSSVAPLGKAVEVDGGVRLSGRFGWSSGSDHAGWAILGYRWPDPLLGGSMTPHYAVVPRADYDIHDDWHVAGLKGTGSKTIVLDDVFVPAYRIESAYALGSGQSSGFASNDGDIYHSYFAHWFAMGFSAVSIGIARRFLDVYATKMSSRVRAYTGASVSESAPAYMRLAESDHQLNAATASLRSDWVEFTELARQRTLPTYERSAYWRTNQSYATKMAVESVDRLFTASGGSAWFDDNEMQRLWRDSKMTGAHTYSDYDIAAQTHGRSLLGLERDRTIF